MEADSFLLAFTGTINVTVRRVKKRNGEADERMDYHSLWKHGGRLIPSLKAWRQIRFLLPFTGTINVTVRRYIKKEMAKEYLGTKLSKNH